MSVREDEPDETIADEQEGVVDEEDGSTWEDFQDDGRYPSWI